MARANRDVLSFNRGKVSELALARIDVKRISLSAETQTNWMPRTLGPMMLRPGLQHLSSLGATLTYFSPFIFSATDTALLQYSNLQLRVRDADGEPVTRPTVTSSVTNGTFTSDLTGWTDADEAGGTSAWLTGGYMSLLGNGVLRAIRTQTVVVATADVEHALRIVVARGPVVLRVGSSSGGDEYINETTLGTGEHSLAFTPAAGNIYLHVSNHLLRSVLIDSISFEAAGSMVLPTPWTSDDLPLVRWVASADVTYYACVGHQQRKLERRDERSWSLVLYEPIDGPFRIENLDDGIILTPSAVSGDITLTASVPLFRAGHVGALWQIESTGQTVVISATGENQFTDPIRVTGVGSSRSFYVSISGTWAGVVTLQRSIGAPGSWADIVAYTINTGAEYLDDLDNQITYYRLGIKTGGYTSGTAVIGMIFASGSIKGIVKITAVASSTSASASVIKNLGGVTGNNVWSEGAWSDYRGWPSGLALHDGRLLWGGKNRFSGSISDAYEAFDAEQEGDAGPISRSIGEGPVDSINWMLSLQRLMMGTDSLVFAAKSSSLDEPLTPTALSLKPASTNGSGKVAPLKVDTEGVYVHQSANRLMQLTLDETTLDYGAGDLTVLVPEQPTIVRMAVQRQPDTRIHCVFDDGTVGVLVYDRAEDVKCWIDIETAGVIEDVVVLPAAPGTREDRVYYVVERNDIRYLERWALESECVGGTLNKQADSFVAYTGGSTVTISDLDHLEGETVIVWADGVCHEGPFVVDSGAITLETPVTNAVVGLPYEALYISTKLNELTATKRIKELTLLMRNTHASGLYYGTDVDHLTAMPRTEDGKTVDPDYVWATYHAPPIKINDKLDSDNRLVLKAVAPKPATVLAAVAEYDAF